MLADEEVIEKAAPVVTSGIPEGVVKLDTLPYDVPAALVADTQK